MKKQSGFIFIETIVVIIVLGVALIPLYNVLYNVSSGELRRLRFDSAIHLYRTYYIHQFFNDKDAINHPISSNTSLTCTNDDYFCHSLLDNFAVDGIYLLAPSFKENLNDFSPEAQRYLRSLDDTTPRLFVSFTNNFFASLVVPHDE